MAVKIDKTLLPTFGEKVSVKDAQAMVDKTLEGSAKILEQFRKKHNLPQVVKK